MVLLETSTIACRCSTWAAALPLRVVVNANPPHWAAAAPFHAADVLGTPPGRPRPPVGFTESSDPVPPGPWASLRRPSSWPCRRRGRDHPEHCPSSIGWERGGESPKEAHVKRRCSPKGTILLTLIVLLRFDHVQHLQLLSTPT